MAVYKVWLTVKDTFGNTKELDGGTIQVDLGQITDEDIGRIEEALPLDKYLKKSEIPQEIDPYFATDEELETEVENIKQDATIKYSELNLKSEG